MKPRRDSRQMISPEYHLIVSEGTKTEPKYFEKIKETIDAKYRDRIHRDEYWPKLTECLKSRNLGNYFKNRTDMFDVLRPYMDDAIRNANMLEEINTGKFPSRSTPGTMVHHLIEVLKPYL